MNDQQKFLEVIIIICHNLLHTSRKGSNVKSDYACILIQHKPLSPCTKHLDLNISSYAYLQLTPTASRNGIHLSPGDNCHQSAGGSPKEYWNLAIMAT